MLWIVAMLGVLCGALIAEQERPSADVIITNARVWTGEKDNPQAEAVAIIGNRIVAVGSATEIDAWRGPNTKIIDGQEKLLLPGFNDAHVHFIDGGFSLIQVQLKDAATQDEFRNRIAETAKGMKPGEWILGGNWDEEHWAKDTLPTKELIDAVTPKNPVFVNRYDGHAALANSLALKLAGITAETKDPPGGVIVRDAQGNPTGVLKDAALNLVGKVIPPPTVEQRMTAAKRAMQYANSLGVTSVQHMNPDDADIAAYMRLEEAGQLTVRMYVAPLETQWQEQAKLGIIHGYGSPLLRMGALKGYMDGSLGSRTAYFFQPYIDAKTRGLLSDEMHPPGAMRTRLQKADAAELQICLHAIGDEAVSIALDMYEQIQKANGKRDRRWRIEHAQHVAPKDFARFAVLGVIASMQPYHAIDDGRWAEKRLDAKRLESSYAWRSMLDHHVALAFGTDWPVAPLDPLQGLYAAVTRATLDGKHPEGWFPQQKINVTEAVTAYTATSAYAEFQEKEKGTIARGKLADMVLLSDDVFTIPPAAIKDVKVEMTMVGGKVVYQRAP